MAGCAQIVWGGVREEGFYNVDNLEGYKHIICSDMVTQIILTHVKTYVIMKKKR